MGKAAWPFLILSGSGRLRSGARARAVRPESAVDDWDGET